jgi:sulfate/thiosulfate transport system substrate-binding protein
MQLPHRLLAVVIGVLLQLGSVHAADAVKLLNVSYDTTREFYDAYNELFVEHWKQVAGQDVRVLQSHGGSGRQARSVIDGLPADVVTLALAYDIDAIAERSKRLPLDWQQQLPNNSSPYTSTIVLLVKKGNPKNIRDWDDLTRPGVQVVTASPKSSGGARWNYLAAWAYAQEKFKGDEAATLDFMRKLFANVPVLDTGARGSAMTFVQRGIGDVLLAWENEALLARDRIGKNKFEIVVPSISILAEPPVAVVQRYAIKHGVAEVAKAYLEYLYAPEAQELIAKNYYRPSVQSAADKYAQQFPQVRMVTIADLGGWKAAQKKHFDDGGTFDQIIKPAP